MSEYINKDAIDYDFYWNTKGYSIQECQRAEQLVNEQPTADVVEVVRCKDCRYWQEYQEGHYPNELCPWDKNETTDEDDYCSYGERREDDKG